jgi:hypothetical protein
LSIGHTPSFTQAPLVTFESPIVTLKKSPSGLLDLLPFVFIPVQAPVEPLLMPIPVMVSSIGFKREPDQSRALVVLVVTNVPSTR